MVTTLTPPAPTEAWIGLLVALGCGLMIGVERERRKGERGDGASAGLRTFTVAALAGAAAEASAAPGLVAVGALGVVLLAALAYWRSDPRDPGLTTELALVATYLIGVLAVPWPALAGASAAVLAGVLAARAHLHRIATRVLSEQEVHDGLLLAALALVVVPMMPGTGVAWLGGIAPRQLAWLVLLILGVQALGHLAHRLFGQRWGLALSGFVGGFVSSSATVAAHGGRLRTGQASLPGAGAAAVFSTAATWLQALVMALGLSPLAAAQLWVVCLAGAGGAAAAGAVLLRRSPPDGAGAATHPAGSALSLRTAVIVAALVAVVSLVVGQAQAQFGAVGVYVGAALAAMVDAHAPVGSALALHAAGALPTADVLRVVWVAIGANALSRCGVAWAAGGKAFAVRVAAGLAAGLLAAGTAAFALAAR